MLDVRYINLANRTGRRRSIEVQGRLQGFDPLRIEAFPADGSADAVLPGVTMSHTGPKALVANWLLLLQAIRDHGTRDDAPWLLILEDDALMVPRFVRRAAAVLDTAPDDCLLVQLGFLSKYTWFGPRPVWKNIVMAGLFVVRGEWLGRVRRRAGGDHPELSRELCTGAHCVAVRVETVAQLIEVLAPMNLAPDDLMVNRARQHPGRLLRSRRQLAIQAPFFFSDLSKERRQRQANLR